MRSPSLEMTQSMQSQVTMLWLFALILCISAGQEDCDRKDCVCRRMYLTYETFATYWFPILFALGIYCLLDGLFLLVISLMQFHPHLHVYCPSARVYFLSLVLPISLFMLHTARILYQLCYQQNKVWKVITRPIQTKFVSKSIRSINVSAILSQCKDKEKDRTR